MEYDAIVQRSFLKGLDASTSKFDQPRGTIPRVSNLLLTRRGAFVTIDGTTQLGPMTPAAAQGLISWSAALLSPGSPYNGSLFYFQDGAADSLGQITGLTLSGVSGGSLVPGTQYNYWVIPLDSAQNGGGLGSGSGSVANIILGAGQTAVQLTWDVKLGAATYLIYRATAPTVPSTFPPPAGAVGQIVQPAVSQPFAGGTISFIDGGAAPSIVPTGQVYQIVALPSQHVDWDDFATAGLQLFRLDKVGNGYSSPTLVATFPARGVTV